MLLSKLSCYGAAKVLFNVYAVARVLCVVMMSLSEQDQDHELSEQDQVQIAHYWVASA